MVADMVGNRNTLVVVGKEAQRADWNGQGASEVDLRLADSRNENTVVVVGKEAQRADWNGQGAVEVEIPDLRLVDSFGLAGSTYRGPMEGCQTLQESPG